MASNVLPLFWPLANSSKETRLNASANLISSLENFQQSFSSNAGPSKGKHVDDGNDDEDEEDDDDESGMEVDASDDEDGQDGEKDIQSITLDRQLSKNNAEDVVYTVKRLVRGLGSSRESSRLGFAVALTELLSRVPTVTVQQVFSLIMRNSQYSKNMKGSEERDMMFARLFGMTSIVQSNCLFAPTATNEDFQEVIEQLITLGQYKAWMRESAWWTLVQAIQGLLRSDVAWKEEAVRDVVDVVFEEKGWTQEKVALVLTLEQADVKIDWKTCLAPTFKYTPLLNSNNLVTLGRVLKETTGEEEDGVAATTTGSWKPQLHFVWNILLDKYFPNGEISASKTDAPFQDFFRVVVDESLFANTSSPQRRYWGFQVFERALPLLPASQMPLIFTPNFMRCWMNNLSSSDRYLHKAAQQIAKLVQTVIKQNPKIGFTLLSQLVGKHGRPDFDKVTKTKTVESIMGNLNEDGAREYVDFLKETILGTSQENTDGARLDERRLWALDQILALCRNGSVPKDDAWVSPLFDFLLVHGFFIIRHANKKSDIVAVQSVLQPPLSEVVAQGCRSKFFGCAVELSTAAVSRKIEEKSRQQGCDASGKLWLRRALDTVLSLEQDTKHLEVITDADDEIKTLREEALSSLAALARTKTVQKDVVKAFEILVSFFVLQTYDEVDDSLENLEEVITAAQQYTGKSANKETEAKPIDLLLDVLIGLLDKGSSDLRNLANLVFGMVSGELTKSSMEHLAAQLERSAAEAAAEQEEEEDEDEDDGAEVDDAQSGDDVAESESEDELEIDDDEELGDVDPAFRARVAAALQVSGMGVDAGNDEEDGDESEDEELWDDDQMMKVDEQLAKVFKERATGTNKKDMKHILTESLHFKNRILDFYDTFAKRQATNPLVLDVILSMLKLIRTSGVSEAEVANKAASILRGKFNKPKDVPSITDVEDATEILQEIHSMAQKAHSAEFSTLCSLCSLFVSRSIEASSKSSTSPVLETYQATLKDFMTRKQSLVHPPFILEFVKRFPVRAFKLHSDLLTYVAPGGAINSFRQLQGYTALQTLAQHLPEISKSISASEVSSFITSATDRVFSTIISASSASSATKEAWNAQKLKDVVKFTLQLARNSKAVGVAWDLEKVEQVGETLRNGERTKSMKSVHSMWTQLEAILGKKKDKSAKVKGKGKATEEQMDVDEEPKKAATEPEIKGKTVKKPKKVSLDESAGSEKAKKRKTEDGEGKRKKTKAAKSVSS